MKKIFSLILCVVLLFTLCIPALAGSTDSVVPFAEDIEITQEEIDLLEHADGVYTQAATRATGLIVAKSIRIAKSGTRLVVSGSTEGVLAVTKAGFTIITVQRRADSHSSWTTYTSFSNLYASASSYSCNKSVATASGYQYRVTCTHYAAKPGFLGILSSETIDGVTGYLSF